MTWRTVGFQNIEKTMEHSDHWIVTRLNYFALLYMQVEFPDLSAPNLHLLIIV
jgi:hypothetical protein